MSDFSNYAKDLQEGAGDRDAAISEGILNLKSKIRGLKLDPIKSPAQKSVEAKKAATSSDAAEKAIDKFRASREPIVGVEVPVAKEPVKETPSTKASRENMKAIARNLAGMRSTSANYGQGACTTPNGNGNVTNPDGHEYHADVMSFTLEEYQAHIYASFGLTEDASEDLTEGTEMITEEDEVTVVEVLEEALCGLEDQSWQEVDRVTREICLENAMSLKELNAEFRAVFGVYPDKYAKFQEELDLAGYFPLEEAVRINKVGQVYDVSFLFRGGTQRFSFFWPEATRPTFDDMQAAVQKFYPRARLLTFYLSKQHDANFMVAVPPMNESYDFVSEDTWVEMSEVDAQSYDCICEEVGEPVASPVLQEDGGYAVIVEDHDTGEEDIIYFGEGIGSIFKKKEQTPEQKRKAKEKQLKDAQRAIAHLNHPFSDVSKGSTRRYAVKKVNEDWQKTNRNDRTDGMSQKAVNAYRRENPGSKLKTAVTEKNPTGKRASRRKSFCSRSNGQRKMHNIDCSKTPEKRICKARSRWNC